MASTICLRCITIPFVTMMLKHQSKGKIQKEKIMDLSDIMASPTSHEDDKLLAAREVQEIFKVMI